MRDLHWGSTKVPFISTLWFCVYSSQQLSSPRKQTVNLRYAWRRVIRKRSWDYPLWREWDRCRIGQREKRSHSAISLEAETGMVEWEGQAFWPHIREPLWSVSLSSKDNPCKGLVAEGSQQLEDLLSFLKGPEYAPQRQCWPGSTRQDWSRLFPF